MTGPTDTGYLDRLYAGAADPWQLSDGFYEQRKRDLVLAALDRPRFRSAFEPGCSTGLLTVRLAQRCESLLASDYHPRAVEQARQLVAELPSVTVRQMLLPEQWPAGQQFQLIVLSELGYFIEQSAWSRICQQAAASLTEDGSLIACHWRHPFAERRVESALLHDLLDNALAARRALSLIDQDFLLDVWTRQDRSPAQRDGRRTG